MGVVLVELFCQFDTGMERVVTLLNLLQHGVLPDTFCRQHPVAAALARRMLAADPASRPSCRQILDELLSGPFATGTTAAATTTTPLGQSTEGDLLLRARIAQLEAAVQEKECTIQKLQRLLAEHGIEHET